MDSSTLRAERSLAFHTVVAARLRQDSSILEDARARVEAWISETPDRPFVREWSKILKGDANSVADFLVEKSERAAELRQSSPFAGVLDARERWRIWEEARQRLEGRL